VSFKIFPINKKTIVNHKFKKKKNNPNFTSKKQLRFNKVYTLFINIRTPVQASIELQIKNIEVRKYWTELFVIANERFVKDIHR
jgi:hypothetical protein